MNAVNDYPQNLDILMDVPVKLTVEIGSCHLPMRDILQLNVGSVIQLDKSSEEPVDLYINNKLFARGEVVIVEDQFGIKITEILGSVK
ncbi:MAG: flagellar motor switch protein FliN [Verrucomicrobia bacterium]|nr:flagellar motor switch protein FliN [Verrucomicrobiota bacterium]MCF7707905.1 flagellar motor switch protein FliN [Verrucomicrobiota bacterium]